MTPDPWRELREALLDVYRPFLEWQTRHFWVLVVATGIATGAIVGLTILGWYE